MDLQVDNKQEDTSYKLESILKNHFNLYESDNESIKRQSVITKLKEIVNSYVRKIAEIKCKSLDEYRFEGDIYVFGSYRLGVHAPGSDIDVLFVAPEYIGFDDFFGSFLEKIKTYEDISDIDEVQSARVPVIKMKFSGIHIDLVFASIHYKLKEKFINLLDDEVLSYCDEKSVYSLNGSRVTDTILSLIKKEDETSFKMALKTIKKWATSRGLYSNKLGYFGGINFAILVAKICMDNPGLTPQNLLEKFFKTYSEWNFDKDLITLIDMKILQKERTFKFDSKDNFKIKPNYHMGIITPSYPPQNSSYNVGKSSRDIIIKELEFGSKIIELIKNNKLSWMSLFKNVSFFDLYTNYIQIDIVSTNEADFKKWIGYIESKLRKITKMIEDEKFKQIKLHPFPTEFTSIKIEPYTYVKSFFTGIKFIDPKKIDGNVTKDINLRNIIIAFMKEIDENRNKQTMNLRIREVSKEEIPIEVILEYKNKDKVVMESNELSIFLSIEKALYQ